MTVEPASSEPTRKPAPPGSNTRTILLFLVVVALIVAVGYVAFGSELRFGRGRDANPDPSRDRVRVQGPDTITR